MKKILFSGFLIALMLVFSCTKDEFTEEDATQAQKDMISYQDSLINLRDSLNRIGGIIQYSVSVIPVSGGTGFVGGANLKSGNSIKSLAGAVVSVSQHGELLIDTTNESGIAVFYNLRVGTVNVSVRAVDYTKVNFIAEITPEDDPDVSNYYDVLRQAATMVPVFSLTEGTSNISGRLTYETDLTNTTPEIASGIKVIAMVDVDNSNFKNNYFNDLWTVDFDKYQAKIVQIAYTELVADTITDTDGYYSIDMPSASDGLPIKLEISDKAVDQQLLMNTVNGQTVHGVQTIRTIFSSDLTSSTASTVDVVPSAYVTFGAPTGTLTQQPITKAQAYAVIGESGISSIIVINQGSGYTQPPIITITGDGEGAEAIAYLSNGKVTNVQITKPGKGYTYANVSAVDKIGTDADATPVITYEIESFTLTDQGSGYESVPNISVVSTQGSGASGEAIMSGYVSKITVSNAGNNYVCPPAVVIDGSMGTDAIATAVMTTYNTIHSIVLSDYFIENNFYETTPEVLIETSSYGSGATALAQLSNAGVLSTINLSNAGLGYTQAPSVLIVGGGGTGAIAYATLNGDGSINVEVLEGGKGYTSNPTVQISAPPTGGTLAVGTAVRAFPIENMVITNAGSGYDIIYSDGNVDDYTNEPDIYIDGTYISTDAYVTVKPNMKVESVTVNTAGTDYQGVPTVTFVPKCGFGSGASATAEVLYSIKRIDVITPGSGYTYDATVTVTVITPTEGCLTQAKAYATKGNGVLSSFILNESGDNYLAPPHIYLNNNVGTPDIDAEIEALLSNGKITGFTITNPGKGYEFGSPGSFWFDITTHTDIATFSSDAYPQSGKISFVTISNPGAGYATEPMVRFIRVDLSGNPVVSGSFTDAEATAVISDGRVVAINITNPGTGYYYEPIIEIFIPDYLEIAKGTLYINNDGYITGVNITNNGMGYSEVPSVTFTASVTGMGSDATGTAVIEDGEVVDVVMTNNGSGYLGKNTPSTKKGVSFMPSGAALSTFYVYAGKSYIKDVYLGTGKRTIEY
ncbi:MAG: hypothetical protein WCX31_11290 [Salinivirgaceae bacterium]